MSETYNIPLEKTLKKMTEESKDRNAILAKIANKMGAFTEVDSWQAIKEYVSDGIMHHFYPVGSQVTDLWEKAAGTSYTALWDIVHYDEEESVYLKWHHALPDGVPFDEPEAIYYFDGTEEAGTYHILIGSAYGTGWDTSKAIQFTLTEAPAANDQLVIGCGTNYANDPTAGRTWNVYAKGSTTSKQTGTTSNGTDGTSLGTIGAESAQKPNGRLNAISRVVYGSGRWSQSAMRQYLNSEAAAGAWWTPMNAWDRPPAAAASMRGFLAGCSADFKSILEPVEVVTALNTVEGYAETSEVTHDKIFLPSLQEMYISPQLANVEGVEWDYFKELAEEAGLSGKFAQGGTYPILISYRIDAQTSPVSVWLRSAYRGFANLAWYVNSSGNVGYYYAYSALRGCPACKIKKSE